MVVANKNLKWGVFTSPQSEDKEFEMYIVENDTDLIEFEKKFPNIKRMNMKCNLLESLSDGYIILLNDNHPMTGMPTYCFESKSDNTHPSSFHRVRIGKTLT
jgi:hypothetical protein